MVVEDLEIVHKFMKKKDRTFIENDEGQNTSVSQNSFFERRIYDKSLWRIRPAKSQIAEVAVEIH